MRPMEPAFECECGGAGNEWRNEPDCGNGGGDDVTRSMRDGLPELTGDEEMERRPLVIGDDCKE